MARRQWRTAVAAAALVGSAAACDEGSTEAPTAPPATSTPSAAPSAAAASSTASRSRLSCPAELVPVTITDRYIYPRPPGTPREALVQQLRSRGYTEGQETWGLADEFERGRTGDRAVTYLGRRADGSVAVELRIERQARPIGWAPTQRRNCEPPRTPPSALQAAAEPGQDPQVTCDPGYGASMIIAGRRPGPGSGSALAAFRAFLDVTGGRFSGTEKLSEDQFVRLPADPDRARVVRFAARREDGSWAAVVEIARGRDSRWRDDGITTCARDDL